MRENENQTNAVAFSFFPASALSSPTGFAGRALRRRETDYQMDNFDWKFEWSLNEV
jgi:hypothetical protein